MSLQPFQSPAQGLSGPQGTSGVVDSSGVVGSTGAVGTQTPQQDLTATTAAQEAQAQQDAANQKDKSKGWSLTNPFQDIGQAWHDVETHTIGPALTGLNTAITYAIKRPITTAALYGGHVMYGAETGDKPNWSLAQGSTWAQAWNESAHISPGNAITLDANNTPNKLLMNDASYAPGYKIVDPLDEAARTDYMKGKAAPGKQKPNFNQSGGIDAVIDWYGDPSNHISRIAGVLRGAKDAPILAGESTASKLDKLKSPSGQAFDVAAASGKLDYATIAEHPLVKGSAYAANPNRYTAAALITAAKTPQEVNLIRQVMAGIPAALSGVTTMAGDTESSAKALDKLADVSPGLAAQASNATMPLDIGEKYAMTASDEASRDQWLQKVSTTKIKAAQDAINMDPETAAKVAKLFGQQKAVTKTSAITNKLAEMKGAGKYANTRDVSALHVIHNAMYAYPVRIYQSLSDRVPGLINHNEDSAVEYARSWLNKSATLSPEEKVAYTQKYASASVADRQRTWANIENEVYQKVGDRFGLPSDQMTKILSTTRKKGQSIFMAAKSRAYGNLSLPGMDPEGVLPSTDETVIAHPQLITQLENGAQPLANLSQLENALERMSDTGLLAPVRNAYAASKDTLGYLLDNVYGLWKPATLMTGHRAFNHIGDDFLRGVAKIGAMGSLDNVREGAGNFLRNNYARLSKNGVVNNVMAKHEAALGWAKADYEGLLNQYKTQRSWGVNNIPDAIRITPADLQAKKDLYNGLKGLKLDFIPEKHRLGTGTFNIPGSGDTWDEAFGGPNADYMRWLTSSHPTFGSYMDGAARMTHAVSSAARGKGFATIKAVDNPARHTEAYVHYIRNQMLPDPAANQIVKGASLDDVAKWMKNTSDGRSYMKALHVGDADVKVNELATMVKTYLPNDGMRDMAAAGKFNAKTIESYLPDAANRPDINANVAALVHGGDGPTNILKKASNQIMHWTGTLPDDIIVRHPLYNNLYKARLTDHVQSWMSDTGQTLLDNKTKDLLVSAAHKGARKDLQNLVYDVSRFNDMGHTLRFVSPFFNAWFNAMSSWSKLIAENPGLLGRAYQAKRILWNSPFTIDNRTGDKANVNTPWDETSFVLHMPGPLAKAMGGMGEIPLDAKTLVSPTYLDAIGNPGFGPLVSIPANQIVKDHPSLMNDAVIRSMLNNMVDKNSMQQLLPSGVNDVVGLSHLLVGSPDSSSQYANNVWSIYQEQYYDYLNGQRATAPKWGSVETTAKWLTAVDLFANRLSPLGFKPAANHEFISEEYKRMLDTDPKNATQDLYDKYGKAGMMFSQSLSSNPTGIQATIGAAKAVNKYKGLLSQFPELGAVIVGPEGNGSYDQMAYDWQIAAGLRTKLTPQEAATQEQTNLGWAQYDQINSYVQGQLAAAGIQSINDPRAVTMKALLTNYVAATGDDSPNEPRYNPSFYNNYGSFNANQYQTRMQALAHVAQDPSLLANPARSDIRSLNKWVQLRDTFYAALQQRPSKSLSAAANSDLAQSYDSQMAGLMQADTKFAGLYDRYLRKDTFKEPL